VGGAPYTTNRLSEETDGFSFFWRGHSKIENWKFPAIFTPLQHTHTHTLTQQLTVTTGRSKSVSFEVNKKKTA